MIDMSDLLDPGVFVLVILGFGVFFSECGV